MNTYLKKLLFVSTAFLGMLFVNLTFAHEGHDTSVSFASGLLHPYSGLDHLLVIVLVGFWSAFVLKKIWIGPCIFVLGMVFGVIAGLINLPIDFFELGIAASVIAIGIFLLLKDQYSPKIILSLLGIFGVFHGFAHAELFSTSSLGMSLIIQDMAGLLVSTAILHLAGVWLVKVLKEKKEIFAKIAGLSSVAYGVMLVGQIFMTLITGVSV